MEYSIRRYQFHLLMEKVVVCGIAFLASLGGAFFVTDHQFFRRFLVLIKKNPWGDLSWITQTPPWGFLILFFVGIAACIALLTCGWLCFQFVGKYRLRRVLPVDSGSLEQKEFVRKLIKSYSIFHAHRRLYCLLSGVDLGSSAAMIVLDKREQSLSTIDDCFTAFNWKVMKASLAISLILAWSLSLFMFYKYMVNVVSGQVAVNNLWVYFVLSFRVFFHILGVGLVIFLLCYVSYWLLKDYVWTLDTYFYDKIISKVGGNGNMEKIAEALSQIDNRLKKVENLLEELIKNKFLGGEFVVKR